MSPILSFIKRYPLIVFFTISIATFYAGVLWMVNDPDSLWFLSIYGTGLGALLVVGVTEGRAGIKAWASRILRWRVGLLWYVVALSLPLLLQLTGYGLNIALGAPTTTLWSRLSMFPNEFVQVMLVVALGEETGFRGYALPKLMENHSPLVATLILAIMRVIWHVPLFITGADSWWVILHVLGADFLFTWIFLNTRGSVLLTMVFHSAYNAWSTVISASFSGPSAEKQTMLVGLLVVLAAVVVVVAAGPNLTRKSEADIEPMAAN